MTYQSRMVLMTVSTLFMASSCADKPGEAPTTESGRGTGGIVITGNGGAGGITIIGGEGGIMAPTSPPTITPVGSGGIQGATEFVSEEPMGPSKDGGVSDGAVYTGTRGVVGIAPVRGDSIPPPILIDGSGPTNTRTRAEPPPLGRIADVEEADIYKIDGTRLLYFNTYRGFLVFDIADPTHPKAVSRLPVFGYPIEMYVQGTTVFALLRDALYLTQVSGKLQFERKNVSQLVAIDISDAANPKLIKTVDIIGNLREGVSRKIENTIYVVSSIPQNYYTGWSYARPATQEREQAWVYSFDVSNPKAPTKVGELKIFEGGSVQITDPKVSYNKSFNNVAISATSNALMVVENWYLNVYSMAPTMGSACGTYESNQQSVVSIIDISDPKGTIRRHTRFETNGHLSDQFKMTYTADETAKTGTFYGIFHRQVWSSTGCTGTSFTQNSIESWDVTDGARPIRLDRLDFGKKNELVRGSAFDVTRKVAYAITAERIDPLYAIGIGDPKNLQILSAVDGLSGEMSVFRLIADRNYLLAVGTDTSGTCTGFDTNAGRQGTKIAVSIIDVRDLAKVRLVQRQCIAVESAAWGTGSAVTTNLDQAHKMIGIHSDATANVITVPVHYYRKSGSSDWWWHQYETAVGILSWDISKYDDTKPETQQNVIANHGSFVHPNGEVRRTIVFAHPVTQKRTLLNLSDTHATLADLSDLSQPTLQSTMEIAPFYREIFKFGDYLVEHVQTSDSAYLEPHEFRVRKAVGGLSAEPLARFTVGQVQQVTKLGNLLVLMQKAQSTGTAGNYTTTLPALIYDFSKPEFPRLASQINLPTRVIPYYRYYCGWAWWNGHWFDGASAWTGTDRGLVFLNTRWDYSKTPATVTNELVALDLSNPDAPQISVQTLPFYDGETGYPNYYSGSNGPFGLLPDPVDPSGFFLTYRTHGPNVTREGFTWTQYRHYAQRWSFAQAIPIPGEAVNLPGPLLATWVGPSGDRMYMTRDQAYNRVETTNQPQYYYYQAETRLALLRAVSVAGKAAAILLDGYTLTGMSLSALVRQGNLWLLTGRLSHSNYGYAVMDSRAVTPTWEQTSDRFLVFDASQNQLIKTYDQPTKAYDLSIMGTQNHRVFLNLHGDGILVADTTNPAAPVGVSFLRTLGYATHMELIGEDLYVASGYFGLEHRKLNQPPNLPEE